MSQPLDFQSIMLTLQRFWADQGCLLWQPYYSQVGAGTMNPATFLRVLGTEPWNVAYVEPSVRPDDGRYGENPNRLQQHYQFQVILKPDPGNPQELYLQSLEALGINPRQHDIRFVEDNWESPALGAWGLGWEVWLDGQEITQFTYFQQAGGYVLNPVSVELTYGLERIAMALQRVRNFRDLRWNNERTYGDVNLAAEQEHSRYYFEVANVDRLRQMYALFEAEAEAALAAGLVLPAHDYVLKCSHTFNVLDTRGAVGVTERQALFGRMRELAHRVSAAYLNQRQTQEYPWMIEGETASRLRGAVKPAQKALPTVSFPSQPADFFLEIGVEELPAADLESALNQLNERAPALFEELRLGHRGIRILGTPRRLVVQVSGLEAAQPDRTVVIKGPPAARSFDSLGQPTRAAEGFARSKGLEVSDLQIREIDGGQYVAAVIQEKGKPAAEVLSSALPGLIASLKFDKAMRWNASGVAFSRPVRWLTALLGSAVVPFEYAGLHSGNLTRGLRFHQPEELEVHSISQYFATLERQDIQVDPARRRAVIIQQAEELSRQVGGSGKLDQAVLDEVNNLVEAPTAFLGSFDAQHLKLPPEVLISVMKKHQRYFPVQDPSGNLLPYFIVVRNGDHQHLDVVADGNEQVIRARFADAAFFIREDLHQPLEAFLSRLGTLTFQVKLGSMLDKTRRIEHLVERLVNYFGVTDEGEKKTAFRAARLAKADLVTKMVVEMTALQGSMGRYYALHSGESPEVAEALYEQYLPRFNGDAVPATRAGLLVGLADRLDTLGGLFAAGLAPSGTKDPFAQRRAALGLAQALIAWELDFDLRRGLEWAAEGLDIPTPADTQIACLDFIAGRLRGYLMDAGFRYDLVDAVLAAQQHNPAGAARAVKQLAAWVARPDWGSILPAYARCVRITRDQKETYSVQAADFVEDVERELYQALTAAENSARQPGSVDDFLACFVPLMPAINRYFESVMVMVDDDRLRANRLGTLQRVAALSKGAADLSLLEGF